MLARYILLLTLFSVSLCNDENPIVETPLGPVVGYLKNSFDGRTFSAFEGIPYAKPPVGTRRFEEPEPVEPWTDILNGTFPTMCAQNLIIKIGVEDCLYINVYVPRQNPNSEEKLDVFVYVHGGAYAFGSGPGQAEHLMDRELIFVSFNYRLGILGFLSTEDEVVPGNNGLKDQVLALEWVQNNIASFGGNPNSVTLFGDSAGASAVHLHYFSDRSKGLFHRGYSESGSALAHWSISEEPLNKAKKLADAVGCPTVSTAELINCLKLVPVENILDKWSTFFYHDDFPMVPFGPVVEKAGPNPFLKDFPYNLLIAGQVQSIPWLASNTVQEGLFIVDRFSDLGFIDENWDELAPYMLDFNYTLAPTLWKNASQQIKEFYFGQGKINEENVMNLTQIFTDRYFATNEEQSAKLQANVTNTSIYYFIFAYPGDNDKSTGLSHGAESKYIFESLQPLTTNEIKMKNLLLDMLASYAKTGVPKFGEAEWKPTSYDKLTYINITGIDSVDIQLGTTENLAEQSFWTSLNLAENENLASG